LVLVNAITLAQILTQRQPQKNKDDSTGIDKE
jgi:hypothetical protein